MMKIYCSFFDGIVRGEILLEYVYTIHFLLLLQISINAQHALPTRREHFMQSIQRAETPRVFHPLFLLLPQHAFGIPRSCFWRFLGGTGVERGGEKIGGVQQNLWVDGEAAEFEDVFRDGGCEHAVLRYPEGCWGAVSGGGLVWSGGLVLLTGWESVGCVGVGFRGPGLDEMSHDVDPFLIPRQDAAPHLIGLKGLDFSPEAAMRASQNHHQFSSFGRNAIRSRDHVRCLS